MFSKADLRKLIIPLMIEQSLGLSIGMIDTVMVSSVGESAVSGVALVESINILLINLFAALGAGGAIIAGQYLGRGSQEKGSHAAKQLMIATAFLSFFIMLICLILNKPLLTLIFGKIEPDVMHYARTYFYLTAASYPFIALYNSAAALFRGMGDSKTAMLNSLLMNVINIIGNSIFIYVFELDVFGAALSTLISRIISALSMVWMLRNQKRSLHVKSYHIKDIDFQTMKLILKIGIPNGLENSMFQLGKIVVTSLVASMGTIAIAAHSVGGSLVGVQVIPGFALGLAITTVVAQCAGANRFDEARKYMKYMMKLSYLYMILLNAIFIIMLHQILDIYSLSEQTSQLAYIIMFMHGIGCMITWPTSFTLPNAFRAAGDVKFTMIVSSLSMWIFRIGGSYFLARFTDLGVLSIWISMQVDWIFRSALFIWRWMSGKWKVQIL